MGSKVLKALEQKPTPRLETREASRCSRVYRSVLLEGPELPVEKRRSPQKGGREVAREDVNTKQNESLSARLLAIRAVVYSRALL